MWYCAVSVFPPDWSNASSPTIPPHLTNNVLPFNQPLSPQGKIIISRNYRGDIPTSVAEKFALKLSETETELPPVFTEEGVTYVFIKVIWLIQELISRLLLSGSVGSVTVLYRAKRLSLSVSPIGAYLLTLLSLFAMNRDHFFVVQWIIPPSRDETKR